MTVARILRAGGVGAFLYCLLSAAPAVASFAGIAPEALGQPVDQIRVSGNERTQEKFILKWIAITPGDLLSLPLLERARQELLDTGLFRRIDFQAERAGNGELVLHVLLRERNYNLLLPRISRNGDGDVKTGIRLRMYNLQGADRTLEMLLQQEEESDGDDSEKMVLRYVLPLFASPYELKWQVNQKIENTEVEDFENVETISLLSMSVARDWHIDSLTIPLTLETGIAVEEVKLDRPYPDPFEAIEVGHFNRIRVELIFDDVHLERYRRFGRYYSVEMSRGFDWLGSDYESSIVKFEAIAFRPLNRHDNFNYRLVIAASNSSPYDYRRYDIGGASSLRGLESAEERGDVLLFANLEYLRGYRRYPGLRHSLFLDLGNVYEDLEAVDPGDLLYTLGTGIRWKIESFVKTDLFLDYGYDVENGAGQLYGGTSLVF